MKKISLLLTLLLCLICTESWAQTVVTTPRASTVQVKYTYTLECQSPSGGNHDNTRFIADNGTTLSGKNAEGTRFEFETADGGFYMKSCVSGKYVNAASTESGAEVSLGDTKQTIWTVSVMSSSTNGVVFKPKGSSYGLNNAGGTNSLRTWTAESTTNSCSMWTVTEYEEGQPLSWSKPVVDGATYAIVNVQPSNSTTRYYYLNNSNGTLTPVDATDKNTLSEWPTTAQFVAKDLGEGKFAFKNKSNKSYLAYKAFSSTVEDWSSWTMHESTREGFENTYWFGCAKRDENSSLTGALIISNAGNFDNSRAEEYSTTTNYSNNYGFVLLKEPDLEREAVINEYNEWKASLYEDDNLRIGAPASCELESMDLAIENDENDGETLRGIFNNIKTTNSLNLPTGYYHFRSIATDNNRQQPYLYNNYFLSNNTQHHTLQSESKVETNAGIWYVVNNGASISIKNGDGQLLVQGNQSQGNNGGITIRENLTFGNFNAENFTSFDNKGIYFTEALNAANDPNSYSVNSSKESLFVTTWSDHANARDNHWTFEPIKSPHNIYNVVIEGAPEDEVYVSMTDGQYAFSGGFLYASDITESQLTARDFDGYKRFINVKDNTITVLYYNDDRCAVTYIYKNGETEWLREKHLIEKGTDYPDLRALPSGVKISAIPSGKVNADEEVVIQCTVDVKFDIPFSANYNDAKWLYATIHSGDKNFWGYDSSTKRVSTTENTFNNAKNNDAYKWAIIGNPIVGYQIINKAAGADMILTSASPKNDGNNGGNTFPVLTNKDEVPGNHNDGWNITAYDFGYSISREGENICLNRRGDDLAYWTGKDGGSRVGFFPVNEAIEVQNPMEGGKEYQARNLMSGEIITDFAGKTISKGNIEGCYHLSSANSVTTTPAIFYASQSLSATGNPVQWSSLSAFSEWIIEEKSLFALDEPEYVNTITSGKYYRLYCIGRDNKLMTDLYSSNKGVTGATAFAGAEAGSQIWKLVKTGDTSGAVGNFTLQNVLTGRYIGDQTETSSIFPMTEDSGSAMSFVTQTGTATDGTTYFTFSRALSGHGLHLDGSNNVVKWTYTAEANRWAIDEVDLSQAQLDAYTAFYNDYKAKLNFVALANLYQSPLDVVFEDKACTQLKSEYANKTDEELRSELAGAYVPEVLQDMAVRVKNDQWDEDATKNRYIKDFRIHSYDIYSDPDVWATKTKVGRFGNLYHPTGIACKAGELLYVMVGDNPKDEDAKLELGITPGTNNNPAQTVSLHAGLNIIMPTVDGEAFVLYRLENTEKYLKVYPNITVHIEGGEATGCFDMHRGHTNNDWVYLCSNMFSNKYLHIMAENTVFCVESNRVRGAENIIGTLKIWDYIFMTEEKLIGHDGQWNGKYNPVIVARDQYSGNPNWSGTSANYSGISKDGLLNYNSLLNGDRWVIYHEEAHGHQYPINLAATTESSNNGFAQMVNHEFGLTSRRGSGVKTLIDFKNNGWGWVDMLRGGEGTSRSNNFEYYDDCVWLQNHMFYQLYLYFHVAGNMPDFWPRLCDKMRENGGLIKDGGEDIPGVNNKKATLYTEDYMKFALAACEVSQTDLSEFFDTWGFFNYYEDVKVGNGYTGFNTKDIESLGIRFVGDYGSYYLKMPKRSNPGDVAAIDAAKATMTSYSKKAPNIMFIDDHILPRTVSADCFAAKLDPTLVGQDVAYYGNTPKQGDFGDYAQFTGTNEANALDYSIEGTTVTMTGDGLVGVKIYDGEGNLKYIYNTETFTVPAEVATALTNGTMTLVAALGDDTNLPLAKPSAAKHKMIVYNGTADDCQTYFVTGQAAPANVPYSTLTGTTDVPVLSGNAMALMPEENDVVNLHSAIGIPTTNVFVNKGTADAPVWNAMFVNLTDKLDFYLPEGRYEVGVLTYSRSNTAGLNSVCLPFDVEASRFGTDAKVYEFSLVDGDRISFIEVQKAEAGKFYIVECPTDATWQLGGSEITLIGEPTPSDGAYGAFCSGPVPDGVYKLNSTGTKFGITKGGKGTVTAFRGYLNPAAPASAAAMPLTLVELGDVNGDGTVSVADVTELVDRLNATMAASNRRQAAPASSHSSAFERQAQRAADVNHDGKLDSTDIEAIISRVFTK